MKYGAIQNRTLTSDVSQYLFHRNENSDMFGYLRKFPVLPSQSKSTFISMWELFKQGKFREATMHWNKIHQDAFLKDLNSMRYLKYWVNKI